MIGSPTPDLEWLTSKPLRQLKDAIEEEGTRRLSERPMQRVDAYAMVRRRARQAGIRTEICNHTFRATGITAYLKNHGKLENARQMAAHASARTTQLYDRRADEVSLDEVERIVI